MMPVNAYPGAESGGGQQVAYYVMVPPPPPGAMYENHPLPVPLQPQQPSPTAPSPSKKKSSPEKGRGGAFSEEEDAIIKEYVMNSVEKPFTSWSVLAKSKLEGRAGKQVRDRWVNHLNPALNKLPFNREDVS